MVTLARVHVVVGVLEAGGAEVTGSDDDPEDDDPVAGHVPVVAVPEFEVTGPELLEPADVIELEALDSKVSEPEVIAEDTSELVEGVPLSDVPEVEVTGPELLDGDVPVLPDIVDAVEPVGLEVPVSVTEETSEPEAGRLAPLVAMDTVDERLEGAGEDCDVVTPELTGSDSDRVEEGV